MGGRGKELRKMALAGGEGGGSGVKRALFFFVFYPPLEFSDR